MKKSLSRLALQRNQLRCCSTATGPNTTHFGNRTVGEDEKESLVGGVFKSVAGNYDVMNDLMSAGIHRCWKDRMITLLDPQLGKHYLDVAGGTGDISFRIIDALNQSALKMPPNTSGDSKLIVSDINASMLEEGKKRFSEKYPNLSSTSVDFIEANAEKLPFEDNSFDGYTIAFGIRNVTHIDVALKEAFRVLKPGGHLLVLEFSKVENPLLESLYDTYSFNVIPAIGHVVAGDWNSYQYLVESIRKFPPQEQFATMIREAGFKGVSYESLTGGVTAIHSGWKVFQKMSCSDSDDDAVDYLQYKVLVVGDGAVGKTSLINRFCDGAFKETYKQTIGLDFFIKAVPLPGQVNTTLQIWDIGGQQLGGKMLANYLFGTHAILLVYDVTNYDSFKNTELWLDFIKQQFKDKKSMPYVALVGNKMDLNHLRAVKAEKHSFFAVENGMVPFYVSAKTGDKINAAFTKVAADLSGIQLTKSELDVTDTVVQAPIVNHPKASIASEEPATTSAGKPSKDCVIM